MFFDSCILVKNATNATNIVIHELAVKFCIIKNLKNCIEKLNHSGIVVYHMLILNLLFADLDIINVVVKILMGIVKNNTVLQTLLITIVMDVINVNQIGGCLHGHGL